MITPTKPRRPLSKSPRVRIQTLGGFRLEVGGGRPSPRARTNSRPLVLLKVLIALGGESVSVGQLCEHLWGDADGDRALAAFHTTLKRLRALIGRDALPVVAGRLSLDPRWCWVDAHRFASELGGVEQALRDKDADAVWTSLQRVLECYRGPFLAGEDDPPPVLTMRERLCGQLLRGIADGGAFLGSAGRMEHAMEAYRRGLEVDPHAEELYRRLMRCLLAMGRHAEGIDVYARCAAALRAGLGAEPSAETAALYRSLLAGSGSNAPETAPGTGDERPPVQFVVQLFRDLSLGAPPGTFSAGLAEDLITSLTKLSHLAKLGRDLAVVLAERPGPIPSAVKYSGVRYVLSGTVQQAGHRLRVNARLVDTGSGQPVWAERFERGHKELLDLQDEIVASVLTEADARFVNGEDARILHRETGQHSVSSVLLHGYAQWRWRMDRASFATLCQSVRRALEMGSRLAWAHCQMVWCYKIGTSEGWLPTEADMLELAEEHALQALRLGPDRGESLTTLGVHVLGRRRFEDALAHAQRGAACDPASSATIANLARCELIAGLPERAALSARRAAALAPRVPPRIWMLLGAGLLMSGQARAALPWLDRAAREVPEFPQARVWQCAGHAAAGQSRSAQAIGQVLLRLHPGFDVGWWTGRGGMFRRERDADLLRDCLRAAGLRTLTAHSRGIGESLRGA